MPKNSSMTPLPTADLVSLTTAVARIDQNVRSIKTDMLPPLMKDTKEARDKARESLTKVNDHIADNDSHEHPCVERPRQERQDRDIAKTKSIKEKFTNLSKLFWIAIPAIVSIVAGSYGYTLLISNATTENKTVNVAQEKSLDRHEAVITEMRLAAERDRATYIKGQRDIPAQVIKAVKSTRPTVEDFEKASGDLPLTTYEHKQFNELLKRAKKRSNGGDNKAVVFDGSR